jgi:membrane associated rhomboid family serine protease
MLGNGSPANGSSNNLANRRNTPESNKQQDGSDNSPVVDVDAEAAAYSFSTRCIAAMLLFTMHWFGIQKWLNWNHDGKSEDDDVAQFLYEFEGAFHMRIFGTSPAPGPTRKHQREKGQATAKVAHLSSLDLLHVRGRALAKIEEAVEPPPELFALQDGRVEDEEEEEDEIVACCRKRPWWSKGLFVACQVLFCFVTWLFFAATYQPYEIRITATAYAEESTLAFKIGDDGNTYSFLNDEKNLESCKTECNLYDTCQGVYFKHHLRSQCVLLADFPAEPCRNNCTIEYDSAMYQKAAVTYWSFANFAGGLESIFPGETTLRSHGTFCEGYSMQAYRLLTYQFTHANLQHVLSTIFCVIFFGIPLELTEGSIWLFLMYQAGIVGGGVCTWLATPHSNSVGASGGSYVLIGWHVSNLVLHWKRQRFRKAKALLFVSFVLADSVCYALREHHGDVDYLAASVGGFIFGLLAELSTGGSVVYKLRYTATKRRVVSRYLASLAFILGMGAVTWYITNPFPGVRSFFDLLGTDFGPWCWVAQACIRPDYSNLGICPSEWQCVACESRDCVEKWYKFAESDQQPGVNIVVTTWSACQGMAKLLVVPPSIAE